MPIANVGIPLYYESNGTGPVVVLLPGYAGTAEMWKPQVEPLSRDHRLIVYELRGHGRSGAPESVREYSAEILVEDHYRLLKHLGVERCVVGGLSMGGYISLRFYEAHPEMVAGLILADTGPGYRSMRGALVPWNRSRLEIAEMLMRHGIDGYAASDHARSSGYTRPEVLRKHTAHGLANVSLGVMLNPLMPDLERIAVPTLILCGERDQNFLKATDYMHERIRGSEKVMLPGAGHAANLDQPAAFNNAVLAFLQKHGL